MSGLLKADIVNGAYSQLRISGLTVNPNPSDMNLALERLENMAFELVSRNINLDFNFAPGDEDPDPNADHNVPRVYHHMLETNLALRLVPDFNKTIPIILERQASQAMANASGVSARENLREVQYPHRQPRGSGNTNTRGNRFQRFFRPAVLPPAGTSTNEMVIGDIDNYFESFSAYLDNGETIESFVLTETDGLAITNATINDRRVNYTAEALDPATPSPSQKVKIVMTTSTGRVETRFQAFLIKGDRLGD